MASYVIALDQGTTSSRAVVFDQNGRIVGSKNQEFHQYYPHPGWVEHDPWDLWHSQRQVLQGVVADYGISVDEIASIGITNQRETTVMWDRHTGIPVYNAIVWQCRRTAPFCEQLRTDGLENILREKTGLPIDAYFSGSKIRWLLDEVPGLRARTGELCCGTVDSWLLWNLTGGKVHKTDATNASRTQLYNIYENRWDDDLLHMMGIPRDILPNVQSSGGLFGMLDASILGREIPITAILGDQHAALFGQSCIRQGMAKNTYGTGCFLLMFTGQPVVSKHRLITTIAWQLGNQTEYALEGSIFMGGATIQWLRDELRFIEKAGDSEALALSVADTAGVYLVPAFAGLGAPYWDMYARGTITGLTRGAGRAHIVRAALESIAYQTRDVLDSMTADVGSPLEQLRVDGGASANRFLMQFQADILNTTVCRPDVLETTAQGVAWMAGIAADVLPRGITELDIQNEVFHPDRDEPWRQKAYKGWQRAVQRARNWEQDALS